MLLFHCIPLLKQRLKYNTDKVSSCLIQFLLAMVHEKRMHHLLQVHIDFSNALYNLSA
jgi:Gpi18-like mannosyltransferase